MNKVSFHSADIPFYYKEKKKLKQWIINCFTNEGKQLDTITYVFCSDDYLLNINKQFLQHDYYTDIITFDLSNTSKNSIEAEVYISVDRVRDNAQKLNAPYLEELRRVIIHGALHLCGYKDKTKQDQKQMRAKEAEKLSTYNLYCSTCNLG
ncbi:MAG: rRNA maturation RNase YbeY [Bacteroidetes bacterium]|nr:rRNA maturation RNase YbeY [Bacteroidota bacterium]MBS1649166.1 rRNA maturation RNase YbeY [Bacteroidota bacterium]